MTTELTLQVTVPPFDLLPLGNEQWDFVNATGKETLLSAVEMKKPASFRW